MHEEPPIERREIIASRLAKGSTVSAGALAREFAVSEDAIRRDLRALAAEGRCRRVYGGALPLSSASTPMALRRDEAPERKHALARAAVPLIQHAEFLFLDNGSTNLALARILPNAGLTVATNSVAIAAALADRRDLRLLIVGGALDPDVGGCVDATAVLAVHQMNIDRCFLGACALSAELGIATFDPADAAVKWALLSVSHEVALMSTNEKLGTRAPHRVTALERVNHLVVEHDAAASAEFDALTRSGVEIVIAGPAS